MTTELAVADKSAASVVSVLEQAKTWLATAVEMTGPEEIAAAKAHIRTAETYARELHLSKDIQQDAQEMVRRAEYALAKSIRKGQEEGTIRSRDGHPFRGNQHGPTAEVQDANLTSPYDFIPRNQEGHEVRTLGSVGPAQFEEALGEAKAEGNLSRANLVRKVKQQASPQTRDTRADLIAELAEQGFSSRQMPGRVGVSEGRVREIARAYGIEIPADKTVSRTRRVNSAQIAGQTVTALEGLVMGIDLIDYADLDPTETSQWLDSLSQSIRVLNRFHNKIKETSQ